MASFMQRTSVGAIWRQTLTRCNMKLPRSTTTRLCILYTGLRHLTTAPIPKRRTLDPNELRSLQQTDGNLRLRVGVATEPVDLEQLARSLKSKINDPAVKAELIVIQLELLYIACHRLRSHWDPEMQHVAKLGAGKAVLEWLWSDILQWSEAVKLYAFTKHLCFFLVAEGLEHHIWEMLENGDLQGNVSYFAQHVWRGVLFRSFVQGKMLIGHSLHKSIDDALATLFVLEQRKLDPLAQPSTMQTSKFEAEVAIVMAMQSPRSANTNPVLWDKFYECYTSRTPRVKYGFERKVAVIRLFHPARPNPWPAYRYIMRHVAEDHPQPIKAGNRETAIEFALAVWTRLIEVLKARGCTKNLARLESLWQRLNFKDRVLQIPKASAKPLSRESLVHTPRQRSRHQIRVDPDRVGGEEEVNPNIVDVGSFPPPLQWQEKQKGWRGSHDRHAGLGLPPVPKRPDIKIGR